MRPTVYRLAAAAWLVVAALWTLTRPTAPWWLVVVLAVALADTFRRRARDRELIRLQAGQIVRCDAYRREARSS